jgi:hypothetical protein
LTEKRGRAGPEESLARSGTVMDVITTSPRGAMVVVGMCLDMNPDGCVKIAKARGSDPENSQLSYING